MSFRDDGFEALLEPFYNGKTLTDPIKTAEDKWQLLPAFLKVKGLVKQHTDSFNFFIDHEIKEIVRANRHIRSEVGNNFWLEFVAFRLVAEPQLTLIGSLIFVSGLPIGLISTMCEHRARFPPWNVGCAT